MKRSEEIIHGRYHDIRIQYEGHLADITTPLNDPHFIRYGVVKAFSNWGLRRKARKLAYDHLFVADIFSELIGDNHERTSNSSKSK